MMSARVLLIDFSRPVAPSMPLSGMIPQEVAHPKCTYIQSDSEDGMGHKALQPSLRWSGRSRGSNAEAERRLHDEEREHDGAKAVEQRRQQSWSGKPVI